MRVRGLALVSGFSLVVAMAVAAPAYAQQDGGLAPAVRAVPDPVPARVAGAATFAPTPKRKGAAAFTWTGFYVGFDAGYHRGNADTTFDPLPDAAQFINLAPTTLPMSASGFSYRAVGGMNRAMGNLIVGVEADWTFGTPDAFEMRSPFTQNNGASFNGTLYAGEYVNSVITARARVGRELHGCLVFGTGGLAFGSVDYYGEANFNPQGNVFYSNDFTKTRVGWTAGAGLEHPVTEHLAIKGEFRLVDLGQQSATANPTPSHPPFQVENSWQTRGWNITVGVGYHFKKG